MNITLMKLVMPFKLLPQKVISLPASCISWGASLVTVMFLWHTTVAVQSRWVLKNTEQVSMPEFKSSTVLSPAVADPQ